MRELQKEKCELRLGKHRWKEMEKFRVPRKLKKKLKKTIWLYPSDKKGNSLMAWPTRSQKDYTALRKGVVKDIMAGSTKATRKKEKEMLARPIEVKDEELRTFVDEVFAEEYRNSSFNTLIEAKKNSKAIVAYYNFINAYYLIQKGEDAYGNVCCMAVDHAKQLLKLKGKK